jgi:glycerate 2-kinase
MTAALARHPPPETLLNIVAAGKASHGMTEALLGLRDVRVGETTVANGSHPLPDGRSVDAGKRALHLAAATRGRDECLVVLLSGGASAMLALPAEGISLADKIAMTKALLASGLPIAEINAVRKHVSAIKGGRLGAAAGRCLTYAISDVHSPVEDDPAVIGSGPTVPDPSTFADALRALGSRGDQTAVVQASRSDPGRTFAHGAVAAIEVPAAIWRYLQRGTRGEVAETPKPGDPRLSRAEFVLAGSRRDAMDRVERIDAPTLGEAALTAERFVERVRATSAPGPRCVVASGETTVTLSSPNAGTGGRNQEFALAAAPGLGALGGCVLASVGTDGIDGPTDAAGAYADSATIDRARAMGLDAAAALQAHDSYPFFQRLGDLIVTGQTGTNVGDLQVLLVT